jgi:transcriptional antiterminator RfaH
MIITNLTSPNLNWYVLYTYPQYEKKVHKSLLRRNFNSFLPVQTVVKQWSDRKKKVEVPLFPNYVFVQTETNQRFKILDFHGVSRFIMFNGKPVTIDDGEIQTIKKMMNTTDPSKEENLTPGDKVILQGGVFDGLEGIIYRKNGKTRFCVKISAINQLISIDISATNLSKTFKQL